jgi:hypothetical protein
VQTWQPEARLFDIREVAGVRHRAALDEFLASHCPKRALEVRELPPGLREALECDAALMRTGTSSAAAYA